MIIEEGETIVEKMGASDEQAVDTRTTDETGDDPPESSIISSGLLISYKNDQLNHCVHDAIKKMSRVKYKCMDVYREYLAFGTSSGGIYLFRLDTYAQSSCNLAAMIPCDAGSVEVIKFLPNLETQDLLIAIGTARGSLVIFRLTRLTRDQEPFCNEIYKAEAFTPNSAIKSIDVDQSYLVDPNYKLEGIYICDTSNRIYILHYNSIVRSSRRSNSRDQPTLLLGVNDSQINQISIYRQILLISTIENSRLFYEQNCRLFTIGTIKRKEGLYGACFYNPLLHLGTSNPIGISTNSLSSESQEPFMCFIARPNFRLWHVNHERRVLFTHKFEPYMASRYALPVELNNEICTNYLEDDEPREMVSKLTATQSVDDRKITPTSVDHFEKLLPIYTKTLGNLLLSYSTREIFVLNPTEADLVVWMQVDEDECIMQVCCYENELFVWTNKLILPNATTPNNHEKFKVRRYILLAPTQMVLELHRMQRHYSLMAFVQLFARQFKDLMAIPLSNHHTIITTEGGLLRNVLLSSWQATTSSDESGANPNLTDFKIFSKIIEQILDESRQLKDSFLNLASSRLYLLTSKENIERLYSEPYTSLITLQVSIASLHTEHVIHFDQETIDHHRQMNLSQTLLTLQESKQKLALSQSQLQQVEPQAASLQEKFQKQQNNNMTKKQHHIEALHRSVSQNCVLMNGCTGPLIDMSKLESNSAASRRGRHRATVDNARVIVERKAPQRRRLNNHNYHNFDLECQNEQSLDNFEDGEPVNRSPPSLARPYFSPKEASERRLDGFNGDQLDRNSLLASTSSHNQNQSSANNQASFTANNSQYLTSQFDLDKQRKLDEAKRLAKLMDDSLRCSNCQWPRERVHCNSLNSSQMIQSRWIESNLLDNFVVNLQEIEQRSFKHGLWNLYLRCLIEKNDYEAYITCCMMLDDVRLLDYDRLQAKTECMDRDLCNQVLKIMNSKLEARHKFLSRLTSITSTTPTNTLNPQSISDSSLGSQVQSIFCLNCEKPYEQHRTVEEQNTIKDLYYELELNHQMDDEFSFNLVNLFEQVLIYRFNDLGVIIELLLEYPNLISTSKIPSSFYLKVIATATLVAKQSPSSKARLSQLSAQRRQRT